MVTPWQIYLITRCDAIHFLLIGGLVLCIVAFIILGGACLGSCIDQGKEFNDEEWKVVKKYTKASIALFFTFLIANALIPTNEEAIAMLSIPAIANSEMVQKDIPQAIRKLWEKYAEAEDEKK